MFDHPLATLLSTGMLAALTLSLVACDDPGPLPVSGGARAREWTAIEARLDALERRELDDAARSAPVSRSERPAVEIADLSSLEQRIARIEQQLAALVARAPSDPPTPREPERTAAEVAAERAASAISARAVIVDPRAGEAAKLAAWSELRSAGPDAWTDAVVAEMTQIGLSSTDAATRADVWRQADARARHPAMVAALVTALVSDPEPNVREEAAETLGNYLEHPQVRLALETAATSDADEDVRDQASRALRSRRR